MKHILTMIVWLVKGSLTLDYRFFIRNKWTLGAKIEFITKKYFLIFLHLSGIKKFVLGESKVTLQGKTLYYNSPYAYAHYQRILTAHELFLSMVKFGTRPVLIDVGANVGFFSLFLADRFPHGKIIAYEPIVRLFNILAKNTHYLDNIKICNFALSNYKGESHITFDEGYSVISALSEKETGLKVKVEMLDEVLKDLETIDLLKIDVETYETDVLEKASKTLEKTRYLLLEATIEENERYTFSKLISMLYSDKYDFQLLAMRNFNDKGEGSVPVIDLFFENILLSKVPTLLAS